MRTAMDPVEVRGGRYRFTRLLEWSPVIRERSRRVKEHAPAITAGRGQAHPPVNETPEVRTTAGPESNPGCRVVQAPLQRRTPRWLLPVE